MREKCLLIAFIGLFVVGVLGGSSYAEIDPETIIGIWLFDKGDGEGNVAKDSSENGLAGQIMNAPKHGPEWVNGKFGDALVFDGLDDCVDLGNDERLKPEHLTVVFWFNTRKVDAHCHIVQSGNNWSDMAGILLRVTPGGFLQSGMARGPGNSVSWVRGPDLSTETWYHAALTFDGANMVLYVDGEKVGSKAEAQIFYDKHPVKIGSKSPAGGSPFDGFIDEVAFFNKALTQEDIQLIMNEGLEKALGIAPSEDVSSAGKLATTWGQMKAE